MDRPDTLDPKVIARLRALTPPGEADVLAEILSVFVGDVPRRIERLREALGAGDAAALQRIAHSLKGSAGNIGARGLFDISRRLDDAGMAADLGAAAPLVDALDAEYRRVEEEIRRMLTR